MNASKKRRAIQNYKIGHHHRRRRRRRLQQGLNQKWCVPVPSRQTRAGHCNASSDVPHLSVPSVCSSPKQIDYSWSLHHFFRRPTPPILSAYNSIVIWVCDSRPFCQDVPTTVADIGQS